MSERKVKIQAVPIVAAPDVFPNVLMQVVHGHKVNSVADVLAVTVNNHYRNQVSEEQSVIVDLNPPSFTDYASFRAQFRHALTPSTYLSGLLPRGERQVKLDSLTMEWQAINDFRGNIGHTLSEPRQSPQPEWDPEPVQKAYEMAAEVYGDLVNAMKKKTNGYAGYQTRALGYGAMGRAFEYEDAEGVRMLKLTRPGMAFAYQTMPEYTQLSQQNPVHMTHFGTRLAVTMQNGRYEEVCLADFFELVEGDNLQNYLAGLAESGTYLNAYQLLKEVILPVVEGYEEFHEAGLVGRDIKEGNIMVATRQEQQVIERKPTIGHRFSAQVEQFVAWFQKRPPNARTLELAETRITRRVNTLIPTIIDPDTTHKVGKWTNPAGTPSFMGPEYWDLEKAKINQKLIKTNTSQDVYAMGVLLMRLFVADPADFSVCRLVPTRFDEFVDKINNESMPEPVKKIITDCTNPEPTMRPNMGQVKQKIELALGSHSQTLTSFSVKPPVANPDDQDSISINLKTGLQAYSEIEMIKSVEIDLSGF